MLGDPAYADAAQGVHAEIEAMPAARTVLSQLPEKSTVTAPSPVAVTLRLW